MIKYLTENNMNKAYKRVKSNKGSHGIDGMTVDELLQFLKKMVSKSGSVSGRSTYKLKPMRRIECQSRAAKDYLAYQQ